MKILVDLTYIGRYPATGIANFAFNLLNGIRLHGAADSFVLLTEQGCAETFKEYISDFRNIEFSSCMVKYLPFTRRFLNRGRLDRIIRKEKIDLFLTTYIYDRSLTTSLVPSIGVIHDVFPFRDRHSLLLYWRFRMGAIPAANSFDRIVAISEATKKEINALGVIHTPIEVIYVSIPSDAQCVGKTVQETPYILDVNTMISHKNPMTLLKAFEIIKDRIPHDLVFKAAESPYWHRTVRPYAESHGMGPRVRLLDRRMNPEEMNELFANADLFVSPSEMEGFGMTPIEAALAGTPVICNDLPALRESTRGLVDYYSPAEDAEALAELILKALANRDEERIKAVRQEYITAYSTTRQAGCFIELIETISGKKI